MDLQGETLSVLFSTILSFGCTSCITLATWPFQGLFGAWSFKRARYTWNNHICMTWFLVGCIGLFTTNLYALLVYPDIVDGMKAGLAAEKSDALAWRMWKGVFVVNMVMQGLWGLHNVHQLTIQLREANKGTDAEFRRPYGMFLWSILGACGGDFLRNLIFIHNGETSDVVTWVTGGYSVICLVLLTAELGYFMAKEHTCGMSMAEDYGKNDDESELVNS